MASSSAAPESPESAFAGHPYRDEMGGNPTHARLLISEAQAEAGLSLSSVAAMEARSGARIRLSSVAAMEARSGARIRLSRPGPGADHRVALVSGLFPQVMDAAELILEKILCQSDQAIGAQAPAVLVVPDACCNALIGKGGAVLKSLAEASNARITISTYDICNGLHDSLVTITGHLDNQLQAIFLILSELLDNVHYSCSSAGFLASPVGCEDGGPDEHTGRYHSRPNTPMRLPDNSKDAQESFSIAAPDEHVGADTEVTGASIGTSANVDLITWANVDPDAKKLDPYYLHLVDNFIEAIAPDIEAKSLYGHPDYRIAYNQQTIEYAESALKRYNREANKTASYELVEGICSCGIKEPEGLYGHVNFTAKNGLDSKVEFFFAELFWDSEEEIFNTTSVVPLEEDDRVGGCHGTEVSDYCDGPNVCVDPQHCYACGADLKHPVDGRLYEIGHKVLSGCYGYDP